MAMGSPSLAAGDTPASIHAAPPRPPQLAQGSRPCASAATPRQRRRSPHRLLPRSPRRAPRQRRTTSAKTEDLYRGDAASELRGACRRRCYWQGVGRLSAPRHGFPLRLGVSQHAGGRSWPRLAATKAGRCFIHRPGLDGISFTVHHGCREPFDSKRIAEIKQGDPSTNRTWSAHQMPSAPPASSPPSGELRSRTKLCSVLGAVILPL